MFPVLQLLKAHWRPVAVLLALVVAFMLGRFFTPVTVVTETKTLTVEKQVEVAGKETTKDRVVFRDRTVVKHADGTVENRDVTRSEKRSASAEVEAKAETKVDAASEKKTVDFSKPSWHANALAGAELNPMKFQFGAQVERRLIGPVWVGAFGLSSGVAGVSVGFEW